MPVVAEVGDIRQEPDVTQSSCCRQSCWSRCQKRTIVVEPILVLAALFGFPQGLLSQLYILDKLTVNGTQSASNESVCYMNHSSQVYQNEEKAQAASSYFILISTIVMCVPGIFVTLFLGSYSDKAGRHYAIVPPLLGSMCRTLSLVLVMLLDLPVWYLLIGSVLEGVGGFFPTLLSGCFSYVADVTHPDERRLRITILELIMMLSAMVGPLGFGNFLQQLGYLRSFLIVLGGQTLNLLYAIFLVPETITRDCSARFVSAEPLKGIVTVFKRRTAVWGRSRKLTILLIAFTLSSIATFNMGLDTLFQKNHPLCWTAKTIGLYSAVTLGVATGGGLILAWLFKFCVSDSIVALIAGLMAVARELYVALVRNTIMMFFTCTFSMCALLFIPSIRTLISKLVDETEQGKVFGVIGCAEVVCMLVGTAIFSPIYAATLNFYTGFVYFIQGLFKLMGTLFLVIFVMEQRREERGRRYQLLIQEAVEEENGRRESPTDGMDWGTDHQQQGSIQT